MNLKLNRIKSDNDTTLGILSIEDNVFCGVVEDEHRTKKVWGETRIPSGTYEIKLRDEGGMTKRYAEKFNFHKGMLWLQNVKGFEYVYIHIGNTDDDSAGCLLVNYVIDFQNMVGSKSSGAYQDLYKKILRSLDNREHVFIKIIDNDL